MPRDTADSLIFAHQLQALSPVEGDVLDEHSKHCPACARELNVARQALAGLDLQEIATPVPASFRDELLEQIKHMPQEPSRALTTPRRWRELCRRRPGGCRMVRSRLQTR
ncbi:hypothetical protein [Streptomyces beijiangensis]|uniref:Zinc-finger domain-containing protein n=1 Tax=Streptomyces beijiangensis TaxID=163361 RepID=A0A939FBI4_9ACTN|nr:hypothetical protein [Streptomyces beijiangensis]MBO0515572.1 hypothetical protein [Streptomyces beijiangensis]